MTDDLRPQFLRRIESAITESRGLLILDVSIIVIDGRIQRWNLKPTQFEPQHRSDTDILSEWVATRGENPLT